MKKLTYGMLFSVIFSCGCGKAADKDNAEPKETITISPSPASKTEAAPAQKAEAVFEGPGAKLITTIDEWSIKDAPRYFGPDNLYDLINGGSEVYNAYGLKKMVTADYTSDRQKGATVTVEIYDMGTVLGAFGRFSKFLEGKTDPGKAGVGLPDEIVAQGIFGGASASFYKGVYLVNLTILDESPDATMESTKAIGEKALPVISNALFEKLPAGDPLPPILAQFPPEHLVQRSQVYVPERLMGEEAFGAGYTARYENGSESWLLFVSEPFKDKTALEAAIKNSAQKAEGAEAITVVKEGDRIAGYKLSDKESDKSAAAALDRFVKALSR